MSPEFRYHVASLSAVFLALGIGILVGTAFVGNKIVDRQTSLIHNLEERVQDFRRETLERERTESALRELVPGWLAGKLNGRSVLVLQTGRYNDAADETERVLKQAGASVTRLALPDDVWYRNADIAAAARRLATRLADGAAVGESEGDGLLRGDVPVTSGRSVVLVGGVSTAEALGADQAPPRLLRERDAVLIQTLAERGVRTVGVEPLAAEVSFLGAWRNAGIATVDCIDRAPGAISLVAALNGETGAFGLRADADLAVPRGIGAPGTDR